MSVDSPLVANVILTRLLFYFFISYFSPSLSYSHSFSDYYSSLQRTWRHGWVTERQEVEEANVEVAEEGVDVAVSSDGVMEF